MENSNSQETSEVIISTSSTFDLMLRDGRLVLEQYRLLPDSLPIAKLDPNSNYRDKCYRTRNGLEAKVLWIPDENISKEIPPSLGRPSIAIVELKSHVPGTIDDIVTCVYSITGSSITHHNRFGYDLVEVEGVRIFHMDEAVLYTGIDNVVYIGHYAGYHDGGHYVWRDGRTSFTTRQHAQKTDKAMKMINKEEALCLFNAMTFRAVAITRTGSLYVMQ